MRRTLAGLIVIATSACQPAWVETADSTCRPAEVFVLDGPETCVPLPVPCQDGGMSQLTCQDARISDDCLMALCGEVPGAWSSECFKPTDRENSGIVWHQVVCSGAEL